MGSRTSCVVLGIVLAACGTEQGAVSPVDELPDDVLDAVSKGESRSLIVLLEQPGEGAGLLAGRDPRLDHTIARIEHVKAGFIAAVDTRDLDGALDFSHLPMMALEVRSAEALARIAAAPGVARVYEDLRHEAFLTESLAVIDQAGASAMGALGTGTTVAVLDTGTDYSRAAFGSCASAGAGGCKVVRAIDFAPEDGSRDNNGHGTNVAGIVLGVAPETRIAALDVFRNDGYAYASDIIAAINWSIANQSALNIVAMNLSLGGGGAVAACTGDVFASAVAAARSAGIFPAIASGNNGYTDRISSPACVPAAVSVGATYDSAMGGMGWSGCTDSTTAIDRVTCFSNSASFLTMLAPGALINAAGHTMGGTSQATPHVAGAAAVLRAVYPEDTIDETLERMIQAGTPVTDHRNGLTKVRLDLATAVNLPIDQGPPTGTVSINDGAQATRLAAVSLALDATDDIGVTRMCISNTTSCTAWVNYATTASWNLTNGDGLKTVRVLFRDARGNTSAPALGTIVRDNVAPTNGALAAAPGNTQISLSWSGATDAASSVASYRLVFAPSSAPSSCTGGTAIYTGPDTSFVHEGLTNGTTYGYRLCSIDAAGNTSSGATRTARPVPETDPPAGTVVINGGAEYTVASGVSLAIAATDANTVTQMCISTTASCTSWITYTTTRSFTLPAPAGAKTVNVWFRDSWGNTSASPASASIIFDNVRPAGGALASARADGEIGLSWSGFTDPASGIASYRLVYGTGSSPPTSCTTGTLLHEGTETAYVHQGLTNGTTYRYRVCARDNAGNVAAGVTAAAMPAPENDPPSGTVEINGGATYTNRTAVTLALSAADAGTVTHVCTSEAATCTAWATFATSRAFTLSSANALKTVRVWFRDQWGNTSSAPATATITLDTVRPTEATFAATRADGANELSWSGGTDTASGFAGYRLVYGTGSAPRDCASGTTAYEGPDTAYTHSGLTNGTTYVYRLCTMDYAGNLSAGRTATAMPAPETDAPSGTVTINGGATYASSTVVSLAFTVSDASNVTGVCVSQGATCTSWSTYAATKSYTVSSGSGTKTVNVWFRDQWGNSMSTPVSDTIILDTTRPTEAALSVTRGDGEVALTWSGGSDAGSGFAGYRLVFRTGSAPANCTTGAIYEGTDTSFTHNGLTNGTNHYYRLCTMDTAGNLSTGVTATAMPAPENEAPTGTVIINAGADYTATANVTLAFTTSDASTVTSVCMSQAATCSAWTSYSATKTFTLSSGAGLKTVNVWFRDQWGNAMTSPVSDAITLDNVRPSNGALTATPGASAVELAWSGAIDMASGIARYRLVYRTGSAPTSCTGAVTLLYEGTGTSATHAPATSGTLYGYRLCTIDVAGNSSTGATITARPN